MKMTYKALKYDMNTKKLLNFFRVEPFTYNHDEVNRCINELGE
jgi:hypothetical protein